MPLVASSGTYNADYYLQVSISGFSSFYFANKTLPAILPVKIKSFTGKHIGNVHELKWEIDCFDKVVFNIERSADGIHFNTIKNISAQKTDCNKPFYYNDKNILPGNNYYRLHILEANGAFSYSSVIFLNSKSSMNIRLINNPLKDVALDIELFSETAAPIELLCTDVTGRVILHKQMNVFTGNNRLVIDMENVAKGIYWIYAVTKECRSNIAKFVK